MTRIKICGIQRSVEVEALNRCRPDYAGFVLAPSFRRVTVPQAARLAQALHPAIRRVGVFVNEQLEHIAEAVDCIGLDVVQLHGDEGVSELTNLRILLPEVELWKACTVGEDGITLPQALLELADVILLDAADPALRGGSGKSFDWTKAPQLASKKVMLAGGLHTGNVARAMELLRPFGVDVSSGVETERVKDPIKIEAFVAAVRAADRERMEEQ